MLWGRIRNQARKNGGGSISMGLGCHSVVLGFG